MVQIWTSVDRDQWIDRAMNSKFLRGINGPYSYKAIPKLVGAAIDQDDQKRSNATEAMANVIYNTNPQYRSISLGLYSLIIERIRNNGFLRFHMNNIMVVVKGGNAYAMLFNGHREFPFSDLDIVIMINPSLPKELYDQLQSSLRILVFQCMSQHKKILDNMFFSDNPDNDLKYRWMCDEDIQMFKKEHINAMKNIGLISPFTDNATRNLCSRNSFILTNSAIHADKVVKVETPHFEMCDRIPLRKSPIFCSFNNTIRFEKDGYKRNFELFRVKFNSLHSVIDSIELGLQVDNENEEVHLDFKPFASRYDRVTGDYIDITITGQDDIENHDFWCHSRCIAIYDPIVTCWVSVPDIPSCVRDLWKMLNVYDCPESKRAKRERKIQLLIQQFPPVQ
jgi:hypothetical protein